MKEPSHVNDFFFSRTYPYFLPLYILRTTPMVMVEVLNFCLRIGLSLLGPWTTEVLSRLEPWTRWVDVWMRGLVLGWVGRFWFSECGCVRCKDQAPVPNSASGNFSWRSVLYVYVRGCNMRTAVPYFTCLVVESLGACLLYTSDAADE